MTRKKTKTQSNRTKHKKMQELRIPAQILMKYKYIIQRRHVFFKQHTLTANGYCGTKTTTCQKIRGKKRKLDKRGPINMCVYK